MFFTNPSVIRIGASELTRQVWTFSVLSDGVVKLDSYETQERASRRHGWRTTSAYFRLNRRESTMHVKSVDLPDDVQHEAIQQIIAQLKVER